jgi:hypothetical protein
MLTRRAFVQSAGVLAAGMAGGVAVPANEIKEHGLVELRAWFFAKDPIRLKATLFSDARRDVFGVRVLGERESNDVRLAELCLSTVKEVVAIPGRVRKCAMTGWHAGDGKKEEGFLDLISREGKLVFAILGQLDQSPRPGPAWLSLSDVREVL